MDRLTGEFKGASMFATVEQAMQYNRLAQYENTGLTPDEIAALRAENQRLSETIQTISDHTYKTLSEAFQVLDSINEQGEIEYSGYSALYDALFAIDQWDVTKPESAALGEEGQG